jgi:hypothetical protein
MVSRIIQKVIASMLYLATALALLLALYQFAWFLARGFLPVSGCAVHYTSLQLGMLSDIGKTLIPSVGGSIALVGAAVGYLRKEGLLRGNLFQIGTFAVFALAIVSLGCWIAVLAMTVDAARLYDGNHALAQDWTKICSLGNRAYAGAIVSAQVGACTFFAAFAIVGVLGLKITEQPAAAASGADEDPATTG